MFYAHTEGRRLGVLRAIDFGLHAATFNIVYPPSLDEVDATHRTAFDMTVNPQSFRLPFPASTWNPRAREFLRDYGPLTAHDLADFDDYDVPRELSTAGEDLCNNLYALQRDFGATEIIAPYFYSANMDDPLFEIGMLCAEYLAETVDEIVFAGVMMDGKTLELRPQFDRLANRLTSPDSPVHYYLDFDFNLSKGRPLRNIALLDILKELFDATHRSEKYCLLARCNIEGLLLRAATGLDAFSTSYYQSERLALHHQLGVDYYEPPFQRAPTPHIFSRALMTDIPRDVAQNMVAQRHQRWLNCGCAACNEVVRSNFGAGAGSSCPAHFYTVLNQLDDEVEAAGDQDDKIDLMLEWVNDAQRRSASVVAKSGTFSHLGKWAEWLEGL